MKPGDRSIYTISIPKAYEKGLPGVEIQQARIVFSFDSHLASVRLGI